MTDSDVSRRIGTELFPNLPKEYCLLLRRIMNPEGTTDSADVLPLRTAVELLGRLSEDSNRHAQRLLKDLEGMSENLEGILEHFDRSTNRTIEKQTLSFVSSSDRPALPFNITLVFRLVLSPAKCEVLIGDLQERYLQLLQSDGSQRATRWFCREVVHSLFSLAFDALKRLSGLEKLFRRIGS